MKGLWKKITGKKNEDNKDKKDNQENKKKLEIVFEKTPERLKNDLFDAIKEDQEDEVRKIVKKLDNVNIKNEQGLTPLFIALFLEKPNINIVRTLVAAGADINQRFNGFHNETPLIFSIQSNTQKGDQMETDKITALLIEHKADINLTDVKGNTALSVAINLRRENIISLLLEKEADVNTGEPLRGAVRKHDPKLVKRLIDRGANLGIRNKTLLDILFADILFTLPSPQQNAVFEVLASAGIVIESNITVFSELAAGIYREANNLKELSFEKIRENIEGIKKNPKLSPYLLSVCNSAFLTYRALSRLDLDLLKYLRDENLINSDYVPEDQWGLIETLKSKKAQVLKMPNDDVKEKSELLERIDTMKKIIEEHLVNKDLDKISAKEEKKEKIPGISPGEPYVPAFPDVGVFKG
jgi:ankyrin repeat protein